MSIQQPQSQQLPSVTTSFMMPMTKPPNIVREYPYTASGKLSIEIEAYKVIVNIVVDSSKITYVDHVDDPTKQAKLSLHELSSWLQQLDKQLSILTLMGIPSPIPSTIELEGVREASKNVIIEPKRTTLQGLGEVKVNIAFAISTSPTTTQTTTMTIQPITKTITKTETITHTTTTTLTKTYTETIIMKETTATSEGVTPIMLVVIATAIVAIVLAIVIIVLKMRK